MKQQPERILVMKFRNIGDVLLLTPLLANLKQHYPDARIDVAVNKGTEAMVEGHPAVDEVIVYDRNAIKTLPLLKRIKAELDFAFSLRRKKYDMVINTTKGDRGAQLAWISGAEVKIGYPPKKNRLLQNVFTHELPPQQFRHTIETNLDVLRVLELDILHKRVEIFWKEKDEVDTPQQFVHIHPVSRWMFKCIADGTMAKAIDFVQERIGLPVVLTAAPDKVEMEKIDSIMKLCHTEPINMAGKLTLKQTAALNKKAKLFIGVDTAIMHISAANDVPVLAFFGPSGADHWGPWDNALMTSGYLQRKGFQTMGKHRVIQESWECVPCGKDGCEGTKISDCLMHLDEGFIERNIEEMIKKERV